MEYLFHFWKKIKSKIYTRLLFSSFFAIGNKTTIVPPLRFAYLSRIQLGSNVTINSNCWIVVLDDDREDSSPKIIIKNNVSVGMDVTISAASKIVIEEDVILSRNVYIADHGHEFHDITMPISCQGIRKIKEVKIGAESWLGQNSVILPGVIIGRHCVIGANSVVNRDVADYSVVVGAPARVIKTYNKKKGSWDSVR